MRTTGTVEIKGAAGCGGCAAFRQGSSEAAAGADAQDKFPVDADHQCWAINTAAKQFRIKCQKDKLACLLKETSPEQFKALDEQLEQLEKITGPDTRFDTSKWLTAFNAHILIQNFSQTPPTGTEGGPLRTIASLIHEYRTGE